LVFSLILIENDKIMDFESDPAAEFLNREREQLGDIMNDNEGRCNFAKIFFTAMNHNFSFIPKHQQLQISKE
jgi:protein required for attachment to host cells